MSDGEIQLIARARFEANRSYRNSKHWRTPQVCHETGVRGEVEFADKYGLGYERIRAVRGGSDGGSDFTVYFSGFPLTFDIKTRDGERDDLLVMAEKFQVGRLADYFVLAQCINKRVTLLGWEDSRIVRCMPVEQLRVPTHVRFRDELRPMQELDHLMMLRDGFARRA